MSSLRTSGGYGITTGSISSTFGGSTARRSPLTDLRFPDGASFAFTVLDDTDDATVENTAPIYELLHQLGVRTTKTVWPLDTPREEQGPYHAGETLQNAAYRSWIESLIDRGFEIAFHNASMASSRREKTLRGLQFLDDEMDQRPTLHCNHGQNRENLYWGPHRYASAGYRGVYSAVDSLRGAAPMDGHAKESNFFWGDIALERFRYVRAFAFNQLNSARLPPGRPFHDPKKPFVQMWFNTADAPDVSAFKRLVTREAVDRLANQGGWCIVSTHLAKGFCRDGKVDPDVVDTLTYLASMPGWFVPCSTLLDHISSVRGPYVIDWGTRARMETHHVIDRLRGRLLS